MPKLTLGIDMGGTGIKMGFVDSAGRLKSTVRFSTPVQMKPSEVIERIATHAQELIERMGRQRISGIGIGCAGDIDPQRGVVRISPNLNWRQVPLKSLLSRRLRYPICVENDANAAGWAAYCVEAKRKIKNLICITVGTGIGSGLILEGRLFRGASGSAGEVGHMTLFPDGVSCACGNRGCTERYVGAKAMAEEARRALDSGEKTLIRHLSQDKDLNLTPILIEQAARRGDKLAQRLWEQAGQRLGITLASVVNLLNPEWIVLSGGLSRAGTLLVAPLRRTILERSFPTPARRMKLVISKLDQDLGIVGAGLLAHEACK